MFHTGGRFGTALRRGKYKSQNKATWDLGVINLRYKGSGMTLDLSMRNRFSDHSVGDIKVALSSPTWGPAIVAPRVPECHNSTCHKEFKA